MKPWLALMMLVVAMIGWSEAGHAKEAVQIDHRTPPPPARTVTAAPAGPADFITSRIYGQFGYTDPDGHFRPAVGMRYRVYLWSPFPEHVPEVDLAFGETDADGIFDVDVDRDFEPSVFEWSAIRVDISLVGQPFSDPSLGQFVVIEDSVVDPYEFSLWGTDNGDGTLVLFGTYTPGSEIGNGAAHLASQATRALQKLGPEWFSYLGTNYLTFPATAPAEGTIIPSYSNLLYLPAESAWRSDHLFRLLGHAWHNHIATMTDHDLCNGTCDTDGCGFCDWCPESQLTGWNEGFALYLAERMISWLADEPGPATLNPHDFESLERCGPIYTGPPATPGYTAALLTDLTDLPDVADDHSPYPGLTDAVGGMELDIMIAMADHGVDSAEDLLLHLISIEPALAPDIWETGMNCGFDVDLSAPGAVVGLASSSHSAAQGSQDATVDLSWGAAPDDASGIAGYALSWATTATMPPAIMNVAGGVSGCSSDPVPPGIWYFNLRAVDRAGRWSDTFRSVGPFAIQTAPNIDFAYLDDANWDYHSFPSQGMDNTFDSAHVTPVLVGDLGTNHLNLRGWNAGPADTDAVVGLHAVIDDEPALETGHLAGMIATQQLFSVDIGNFFVRGGRHNFHSVLEGRHIITETDEDNNYHGRQFVWTGAPLTAGLPVQRTAPPFLEAGGNRVPSAAWFVCDGLSFSSAGWWSAVAVRPLADDTSYAARLHVGSTGSEDGFAANLAFSARPQGTLNAVLVNRNTMGDVAWDVGVLNGVVGGPDYEAVLATSQTMAFGDSLDVVMPAGVRILLREIYVAPADTGYVNLTVNVQPGGAGIGVNWLGSDFQAGTLLDGDAVTWTDDEGRALVEAYAPTPGYRCLVVYRDDLDVSAPLAMVVEAGPAMADLVTALPTGWAAPLVPRPADDGQWTNVALPDTLHGNLPATYINYATANVGHEMGSDATLAVRIDGAAIRSVTLSYPAPIEFPVNRHEGYTVRGGRHMATLAVDITGNVEETREDNNAWGRSWVWSPLELAFDTPLTRAAPPDPTGGMDEGGLDWFNCDGLRQPIPSDYWTATAVMPVDAGSNPDVRLHPVAEGAQTGFAENLVQSAWAAGESDFVLTNHNYAEVAEFDVGVVRGSSDSAGDYVVEAVESTFLGRGSDSTTYGPFTMGANEIVDLYEFSVEPGIYHFVLENESGGVDWGLSLHRTDARHQAKSSVVEGGARWLGGAGQNEYMDAVVTEISFACLSVWKRGSDDLPLTGTYSIRVLSGLSGVDGETAPAATRLAGAAPNPFNPRTTVAYELAVPGRVRLTVYDLTGARVADLVDAAELPGHHRAVWTGRDAAGRAVASGVYFARLTVDGKAVGVRKLALLK